MRQVSVVLFAVSVTLFFVAFHNLDLLQNYSIIYNQINKETCESSVFMELSTLTDCNLFDCPDFRTIYIRSKTVQGASFVVLAVMAGWGLFKNG